MPTMISPLDQSLAYTYCPFCRSNGNLKSPLQRDSLGRITCQFGHTPDGEQLQAMGADMVKANEIFQEQPTPTDIKWSIYVNPGVKEKLEKKLAGRLMISIGTLLAAMADDSLVIISGEQARKLKELGVRNGQDMLAALESSRQAERDKNMAMEQITRFQQLIHSAGE